jgi:hypothetical protein
MKIIIMYKYSQHVRRTMIKKKQNDIVTYMRRNDFDQLLTLKDYEENELNQMKIKVFRKIESKKKGFSEEQTMLRLLYLKLDDATYLLL